jgi:hypothetical protein
LQRSHHVNVVANEQRLGEITGWAVRWWRHAKELQENVQSEKDEHATQDNSGDRSDDFHNRLVWINKMFFIVGFLRFYFSGA